MQTLALRHVDRIERELQSLGVWQSTPPVTEAITLLQWLFLLVPRARRAATRGAFSRSMIVPRALIASRGIRDLFLSELAGEFNAFLEQWALVHPAPPAPLLAALEFVDAVQYRDWRHAARLTAESSHGFSDIGCYPPIERRPAFRFRYSAADDDGVTLRFDASINELDRPLVLRAVSEHGLWRIDLREAADCTAEAIAAKARAFIAEMQRCSRDADSEALARLQPAAEALHQSFEEGLAGCGIRVDRIAPLIERREAPILVPVC